MKNFIKQRLTEAFKNFKEIPYDPKPEMKAAGAYSSLSDPSYKKNVNKLRHRIAMAAQIATQYKSENPEDNYFMIPTEGDGFYQVEFRHDGQIKTKHIKASADMTQQAGPFQPSDVGTCKDFQNIARYCFVKAGKDGHSVGASPAEDAANKALIIFKNEILSFMGDSAIDPEQSAQISKEKMDTHQAKHKEKKDLEAKIGRRLSDSEWLAYQETGQEPKGKPQINMDPTTASDIEKRQAEIQARIAKAKARMNK